MNNRQITSSDRNRTSLHGGGRQFPDAATCSATIFIAVYGALVVVCGTVLAEITSYLTRV